MQCKHCGRYVDEKYGCCTHCGKWAYEDAEAGTKDRWRLWIAILSFLFPPVGLVLFLVWRRKKPKRADSAGKGALIGVIAGGVAALVFTITSWVLFTNELTAVANEQIQAATDEIFHVETTEEMLEKYVDVSLGNFTVKDNGFYSDTSLVVTVTNKAAEMRSYMVSIEAVKSDGTRIGRDTVYATQLKSGQKVELTAFTYINQDEIALYKNAKFKVLTVTKF